MAGAAAAAATAQHLFIETSVDPAASTPYVQQQVPYTVRLYYDDSVREGELGEPQIADAIVERIGEDRHSSATRNGRQYQVLDRRYAIFPQQSGVLEIPAARFQGRMVGNDVAGGVQPRRGSLMQQFLQNSPFANAPFFRGGAFRSGALGGVFGDPGQSVQVASSALQVTVRPPANTQGAWLPARGIRLHDSWTDAAPQLRVGEPVSRTITIEADGLSGSQIPALDLPTSKQLQVYQEPVERTTHNDGDQLVGISRQTLTYMPNAAGALEVPAVTLAWWNTTQDTAASTALPGWQLVVQAGADGPAAQVPPPAAASADVIPQSAVAAVPAAPPVWRDLLAAHWVWLAVGIFVLAGLAVWWRLQRRRHVIACRGIKVGAAPASPAVASRTHMPDRAVVLRRLETACDERDAAAAARALLALAAMQWPERPPRNLNDLARRLGVGAEALRALDRYLYGDGGASWPAEALWRVVRDGLQERPARAAAGASGGLPPLYPRQA